MKRLLFSLLLILPGCMGGSFNEVALKERYVVDLSVVQRLDKSLEVEKEKAGIIVASGSLLGYMDRARLAPFSLGMVRIALQSKVGVEYWWIVDTGVAKAKKGILDKSRWIEKVMVNEDEFILGSEGEKVIREYVEEVNWAAEGYKVKNDVK